MTINAYTASVPVYSHMLTSLKAILEKAVAFEIEKKLAPTVLPNLRLAVDMLPLSKQVQIASDNAKGAVARLSGQDVPAWADTETTLPELIARVDKTIAYLATFTPEQFVGCESKAITLKAGPREFNFTGEQYQLYFAQGNIYFHITTTYNILRNAGVQIGKRDFLGG